MNELEQLRHENAELQRKLQSSNDLTRMYLQNVAHQLTAPLGAIKWSIEAIKDEAVPLARKGNLLRSVYSQAGILVHLIKNFALMSNLEADEHLGQMRNQEPVELMLLAINLANDFQPQAADVEKKITVDEDSFTRTFGIGKVNVEKNLVAQAVSNLLENAVKYGDARTTINIRATHVRGLGAGMSVSSIGLPIDDGEKSAIFERSFRGAAAKQRVATGTGIGLYLASRVMQLHDGEIRLDITGREACFTLIFPSARIKK